MASVGELFDHDRRRVWQAPRRPRHPDDREGQRLSQGHTATGRDLRRDVPPPCPREVGLVLGRPRQTWSSSTARLWRRAPRRRKLAVHCQAARRRAALPAGRSRAAAMTSPTSYRPKMPDIQRWRPAATARRAAGRVGRRHAAARLRRRRAWRRGAQPGRRAHDRGRAPWRATRLHPRPVDACRRVDGSVRARAGVRVRGWAGEEWRSRCARECIEDARGQRVCQEDVRVRVVRAGVAGPLPVHGGRCRS